MTPTEHVSAARKALAGVRTDVDFDAWHDTWASGESYLLLPDAEAREIDAMADEGRQLVLSRLFPIMAG